MGGVSSCCRTAKGCPFCDIIQDDGSNKTRLMYKDDKVAAFRDRRPAAVGHYQVVPLKHIPSVLQVDCADQPLIDHMQEVGEKLVHEYHPGMATQFGFHVPPFTSIDHLHMHCLALPFNQGAKAVKYTKFGKFRMHWWPLEDFKEQLDARCCSETTVT